MKRSFLTVLAASSMLAFTACGGGAEEEIEPVEEITPVPAPAPAPAPMPADSGMPADSMAPADSMTTTHL